MTTPYQQQAYGIATGSSPIPTYVFRDRDPTTSDTTPNYPLYTSWVNTDTKAIWYLEAFSSSGGAVTSQWRAVGPIVVSSTTPTSADYNYPLGQTWVYSSNNSYWVLVAVSGTTATWIELTAGGTAPTETLTGNSGGAVGPDSAHNINLLGASGQVVVTGNPGTNTLTISLAGGSTAIDSIGVDANTAPGTNPVLPTSAGLVTITGGQVAAATTANVIRTDSLAANTFTVEIQRSQAVASTTIGSNGVSHFKSDDFSVDANGFVSLVHASSINAVVSQVFTSSGTYTPTTGMKYCLVHVVGGGGGGAGCSNTAAGVGTGGGGGGGGGYAQKVFTAAQIGASQTVTIGAAGTGGAAGANNGVAGGTTSLGALISATGGSGGNSGGGGAVPGAPGGAGGAGSSGDFNTRGSPGGNSIFWSNGAGGYGSTGGEGGSSFYGGGANSPVASNAGNTGLSYGGGGSGAASADAGGDKAGGDGFAGIVVVTEYISN